MERTVTVRTPESVAFHYELAGLGSRFLAVTCDLIIQSFVAFALFFIVVLIIPSVGDLPKSFGLNASQLASFFVALAVLVAFVIFFGYFIAFEALWNGQTPGKRLLGIRVVRDGGYPIDTGSSVLRNLIRIVEAALGYVPSAISVLLSSQNKRLGDYAAGTIVVRDRAFEVTSPQTWLQGDSVPDLPPIAAAQTLSAQEWALVDRYVERRASLPPAVAAATATRIAAMLRPKLGADASSLSDDAVLMRLFASRR
ncbi:MAG: RDD family protein [Candidatus Eremiobacteraeota bacterium]|nr:RDD family protein [Candidatus Eremiobacteraeota bacterium]MBV8222498.1 RDD family protein [Candidatus Eremiobacteraeota bacterium]MBV8280960.1 RDD family protein [Candidatus Eremiobacteraeota bacterium]